MLLLFTYRTWHEVCAFLKNYTNMSQEIKFTKPLGESIDDFNVYTRSQFKGTNV